jgi:hypothetical protein
MPQIALEENMSAHLVQPRRSKLRESLAERTPTGSPWGQSLSPGLERELRNSHARATLAERSARVSRREGDLRRARQARQLAERAVQACQMAA